MHIDELLNAHPRSDSCSCVYFIYTPNSDIDVQEDCCCLVACRVGQRSKKVFAFESSLVFSSAPISHSGWCVQDQLGDDYKLFLLVDQEEKPLVCCWGMFIMLVNVFHG